MSWNRQGVDLRHRKQVNPFPLFANPANDGAPARTKTKLRSDPPEWYHPHRSTVNRGNHEHKRKGEPPALDVHSENISPFSPLFVKRFLPGKRLFIQSLHKCSLLSSSVSGQNPHSLGIFQLYSEKPGFEVRSGDPHGTRPRYLRIWEPSYSVLDTGVHGLQFKGERDMIEKESQTDQELVLRKYEPALEIIKMIGVVRSN